ncbi:hypothetical protein P389DRAFT_173646 [Cystobasidium minutum MCA 4210]|uniref:uncharacterized protein n=1 Tax=Cystobasidium minutum MCA 4210 TaxID=1397322 RepID=UPI0034CEC5E2|eukprot:jgi/Rhomi1/173646/fgenesh1_kg.6_\
MADPITLLDTASDIFFERYDLEIRYVLVEIWVEQLLWRFCDLYRVLLLALMNLGLVIAVGSALFFGFWYMEFVTLPWLKGYTGRRPRRSRLC